jgi:hypothetical protein
MIGMHERVVDETALFFVAGQFLQINNWYNIGIRIESE